MVNPHAMMSIETVDDSGMPENLDRGIRWQAALKQSWLG